MTGMRSRADQTSTPSGRTRRSRSNGDTPPDGVAGAASAAASVAGMVGWVCPGWVVGVVALMRPPPSWWWSREAWMSAARVRAASR